MLIFLLVIIGLSLLILGHEAGHFVIAKLFGLKVDEFGFGFPPRIWAWRPEKGPRKFASSPRESAVLGETEYSFNWLPFGGFVKIAGENDPVPFSSENDVQQVPAAQDRTRLFFFQPAWKKAAIVAAGVAVNFVLGWILLSVIFMVGVPKQIVISGIQPGSPAEEVGLLSGDVIKGFAGSAEFIEFVNVNKGKEIELDVERQGKELSLRATPRADLPPGEGALGVFIFDAGEEPRGFFAAIWGGLKRAFGICVSVAVSLFYLVRNLFFHGSLLEGVVGPVGIFSIAYGAGGLGPMFLIQLIAVISMNLAVVNLIPFPALDGGRLLLIGIEKIKGSPVPRKVELIANGFGFAFLLFLMMALTARDVSQLF